MYMADKLRQSTVYFAWHTYRWQPGMVTCPKRFIGFMMNPRTVGTESPKSCELHVYELIMAVCLHSEHACGQELYIGGR
jgi:hypothetical protein